MSKYVDAEFERVQKEQEQANDDTEQPNTPEPLLFGQEPSKSLMELSLEADPEIMNARIPFFDPIENTNYIDVKLAFMAQLDGVSYGIGVPFDPSVAVVIEDNNSTDGATTLFLSPYDDEN